MVREYCALKKEKKKERTNHIQTKLTFSASKVEIPSG